MTRRTMRRPAERGKHAARAAAQHATVPAGDADVKVRTSIAAAAAMTARAVCI